MQETDLMLGVISEENLRLRFNTTSNCSAFWRHKTWCSSDLPLRQMPAAGILTSTECS